MRTPEETRAEAAGILKEAMGHVIGVIRLEVPSSGDAENDAVNQIALARAKLDVLSIIFYRLPLPTEHSSQNLS